MKLRLIMTEDCNRNCEGCCNKDWDIKSLPVPTSFKDFEEIIITGGEPLLHRIKLLDLVSLIRNETTAPIILYTALLDNPEFIIQLLYMNMIDGLTITLHENEDKFPLFTFLGVLMSSFPFTQEKTLRINIFEEVELSLLEKAMLLQSPFKIKSGIRWITNCSLPNDEVLMRLPERN